MSFDAGSDPDVTYCDLYRLLHIAKEDKLITSWTIDSQFEEHAPIKQELSNVRQIKNNFIRVNIKYPNGNVCYKYNYQ